MKTLCSYPKSPDKDVVLADCGHVEYRGMVYGSSCRACFRREQSRSSYYTPSKTAFTYPFYGDGLIYFKGAVNLSRFISNYRALEKKAEKKPVAYPSEHPFRLKDGTILVLSYATPFPAYIQNGSLFVTPISQHILKEEYLC